MKTIRHLSRAILLASALAGLASSAAAQEVGGAIFPDDFLPPLTGAYAAGNTVSHPTGVRLANLDIRLPDTGQSPPAIESVQVYHAVVTCDVDLGSGAFQQATAPADVTVRMTPDPATGGFDTEMLQLDIRGGSLPGGLMIRESPTRASAGRTTIESLLGGTHRIDSFFDIFTEVSLDGGQSWAPSDGASHAGLKKLSEELSFPSPNLLPPADHRGGPIVFANGIVLANLALAEPTNAQPPPPPGGQQVGNCTATLTGEISNDGGATFQPFSAPASLAYRETSMLDSGATRYFDTEMLALNVTGGGFMLRESPTRASLGRTSIRQVADGTFGIGSFFDIFTELSLDGGASWSPASNGACHFALPAPVLVPVVEHFHPLDCFPARGSYGPASDVSFANGVVLRGMTHRVAARRQPLPGAGQAQTQQWGGTVEGQVSLDGGATFTPYLTVVFEEVLVSGFTTTPDGGNNYPMESLSLNFTLPGGVMVRESPTKASTGRTSVRAVDDGFMIGSFFDVFTEVSLDGGQNWTPADGAAHLSLLPYVEQTNVFKSDFFPPRDGSLQSRKYAPPLDFGKGWQMQNARFASFGKSSPLPPVGAARIMEHEGIFYCDLSSDGGLTFAPFQAPAVGVAQVRDTTQGGATTRTFDTEMLQLNISGGGLPAGVMLRESPTRASTGQTRLSTNPRIGQEVVVDFMQIDSFFDIFTELSVDGGQNWAPADGAAHLDLHARPAKVFHPSNWLPLAVQYRESDFDFAASFGNGAGIRGMVVTNAQGVTNVQNGRQPHPGAGASLTKNVTTQVDLQLTLDGGQTFTPVQAQAYYEIKFTDLLVSSFQVFDTEMLALDLSGGTLPPGVMLRESPTRRSAGRTTVHAQDSGYSVDSFFDIFTEISLDGGQTWTPSCDTLRLAACDTPVPHSFTWNLAPPRGRLVTPPGDTSLRCATGKHIKDAIIEIASDGAVPPPAPGQTLTVSFSGTESLSRLFRYSLDDGQTFQEGRAPVQMTVTFTDLLVSGYQLLDTEVTEMSIAGGSLPPGMMLRESPTRQSLGQTKLRPSADGTFRIDSFFDIFTELSMDGGTTWEPFDLPLHFGLEKTLLSSAVANVSWPLHGHVKVQPGDPDFDLLRFANGAQLSFFDVFISEVTPSQPLPETGAPATFDWQAPVSLRLALPGGPPVDYTTTATIRTLVTRRDDVSSDGFTYFDTEMLALELTGGSLPPGVMLRESPTRASTGGLSVQTMPDGTFRIGSFFDIFTEISLDGGQTWSPSEQFLRLGYEPDAGLSASAPEHFYPTDCFPLRGSYENPDDVIFANGIVLRSLRHTVSAQRQPLPGAGQSQTQQWGGTVEVEFSRDGGATFTRHHDVTFLECYLTGYSLNGGGGQDYPMESLTLNFTLPGGVMVRESPTRASTGRTSVRAVEGGFMIGSFFDIFTEVSLDGGQSWTPANDACRTELVPAVDPAPFASDFFPPRTGSFETRRYEPPLDFGNGWQVRNIRFASFTKSSPLPALAATQLMEEEGIFYFEISSDGGKTFSPGQAPALGNAEVQDVSAVGDPVRAFDTEMLALDISGGTLPPGVMLRESPTRASTGRTSVLDNGLRIGSFFDVFTELSTDGGTTWSPASDSARLELHAEASKVFTASNFAPLAVQYRETDYDFASFTGNAGNAGNTGQAGGIRALVIDDLSAQPRQPPPVAGQSLTQEMTANVALDLTLDGGQTFTRSTAAANGLVRIRDTDSSPDDGVQTFDTEMLALNLGGGSLPQGVMLRESPTRASTGRTTIRAVAGGFMVDSFFDIFTELSFDGGQTWTPACDPIHVECDSVPRETVTTSRLLPPAGDYAVMGDGSVRCASGEHIKGLQLDHSGVSGNEPPTGGATLTYAQEFTADLLYSPDDGRTFKRCRAPATAEVSLQDNGLRDGVLTFDTEMLVLNIAGGTLPPGVMIRESPTRASTGRTSLQDNGASTYRISSFFDIFTEISLDGGGTWQPCDGYLKIEIQDVLVSSFSASGGYPSGGGLLPTDQISLNFTKIEFSNGSKLDAFDMFMPTGSDPLPAPGQSNTRSFDTTIFADYVSAGGSQACVAPVHVSVQITHALDDGRSSYFDTEMLAMDISGGSLPPGVMIRESPTLRSDGRLTRETRPGGNFRMDSFFDIFTEISLDGGQTWSPSDGPQRMAVAPARAPNILKHPVSQRVLPGSDVAFAVEVAGYWVDSDPRWPDTLAFQWSFNGRPIAGATGSTLALPAVQLTQSGFYSVAVTNTGGTVQSESAELLVVRKPFTLAAGNFNGLILPSGDVAPALENMGVFKLKLSRSGSFTGTVQFAGRTHSLRGAFGLDGNFRADFPRPGLTPLTVQLHIDLTQALDLTNPSATITGAFTDGTHTSQASTERVRYIGPLNPTPHSGRYTVLLQTSTSKASGYATMNVTTSGAVSIAGQFVDRSTLSYGAYLGRGGTLPLFVSTASGSVSGDVLFREIPHISDCDASLTWLRISTNGGLVNTRVKFIGSRYVPPAPGTRVLHFANTPGNAEVTFGFISLNPLNTGLTKVLTVSPSNAITVNTPGTDKLKMSIALKTGLFSGTFYPRVSGPKTPFNGAVLQKQDIGGGIFTHDVGLGLPKTTGSVVFGPR